MISSIHTRESGIVKDVLAELARDGMDKKYLGGGIGVQFYLPSEFYRRTSDIDLDSSERFTSGTYHNWVVGLFKPLVDRGYSLDFSKQRSTYDALLEREGQKVILQIRRRSTKNFEDVKKRLEREFANSEIIPYAEGKMRVLNINDLIAHKISRAEMFSRAYSLDLNSPLNMSLEDGIERANILKENLDFSNLDPEEIAKNVAYIRLLSDVMDVKAMIRNSKIDEKYIRVATSDLRSRESPNVDALADELLFKC